MALHIVITGANRGIGLALTQQYCAAGAKVTALCRRSSTALEGTGANVVAGVDMQAIDDLHTLGELLGNEPIDILINNAGILRNETLGALEANTIREQFEVNALAPMLVTEQLLGNMPDGAKVIFITSRMGSISDNGSGGYYGYRMSKAALNAGAQSMARDLAQRGIAVGIIHPGFVQTDMVGGAGDISASGSAANIIARIDEVKLSHSGRFVHADGSDLPW
ncbi:SDR family oxidoreductase [bacterium]|nr:SDR family oxidoreductase [bacterium]